MKVFFDSKGRLTKQVVPPIFATEHKVTKITAFADFDTSSYDVSITFKRPDGISIGPLAMEAAPTGGHVYELTEEDTNVSGTLNATIRYELYQYDQIVEELVPTFTKVMALIFIPIYDSVKKGSNNYAIIEKRIKNLETKFKDIDLDNLDEITISREEPLNKGKGHLWGKILN